MIAKKRKKFEEKRLTDPVAAQRDEDFFRWRTNYHMFHAEIPAHALNLYRDPGRAKTHAMLVRIKHNPEPKDFRQRFTVTGVGVYKIEEAVYILDRFMSDSERKETMKQIAHTVAIKSIARDLISLHIVDHQSTWTHLCKKTRCIDSLSA
ncbi:hypothetical protein AX16_004780 [Volvariella volvacea WC 439]|nr:hypothetical protein AX16_004780 [Volvariella volvacea WC 439]